MEWAIWHDFTPDVAGFLATFRSDLRSVLSGTGCTRRVSRRGTKNNLEKPVLYAKK
jgi:hypothetical protein